MVQLIEGLELVESGPFGKNAPRGPHFPFADAESKQRWVAANAELFVHVDHVRRGETELPTKRVIDALKPAPPADVSLPAREHFPDHVLFLAGKMRMLADQIIWAAEQQQRAMNELGRRAESEGKRPPPRSPTPPHPAVIEAERAALEGKKHPRAGSARRTGKKAG